MKQPVIGKENQLSETDLPITLYLNQRLTFDLLAVLQGGFSSLTTVQTTSAEENTANSQRGAGLGISNVFAFLGVNLNSAKSRQHEDKISESTTEELVHTPASLFAQLRKELMSRKLVHNLLNLSDEIDSIRPSHFVEFEATLRRNPLVDMLDSISEILPLIEFFDTDTEVSVHGKGRGNNPRKQRNPKKPNEYTVIKKQVDTVKKMVTTADGNQDFLAEIGGLRVVLPIKQSYFIDPSMNDVIDGTFRVFGKVTRVISDDRESINLLRKTAVGKFDELIRGIAVFESVGTQSGFDEEVEISISGPTMQVIPIAIFS